MNFPKPFPPNSFWFITPPACRDLANRVGTVALLALLTCHATAGTETHGGNGVFCSGSSNQSPQPGLMLDYYHAALPPFGAIGNRQTAELIDLNNLSEVQTVHTVIQRLGERHFAYELREAIRILGYSSGWIAANLKDYKDTNEQYYLPEGCTLKTVALRQGQREMLIDPTLARLLSPVQLGILDLHEAIYYIASLHGQNTSEHVRALMRELLQKDIDDARLDSFIIEAGGVPDLGSMFEILNYSRYVGPADAGREYFFETGGPRKLVFSFINPNTGKAELAGNFTCGGLPFHCEGLDPQRRNIYLDIPGDEYRFLKLHWFWQGQWTETQLTAIFKTGPLRAGE